MPFHQGSILGHPFMFVLGPTYKFSRVNACRPKLTQNSFLSWKKFKCGILEIVIKPLNFDVKHLIIILSNATITAIQVYRLKIIGY